MPLSTSLPVRVTDDLRIEADPGASLTPAQGLALGEDLIRRAVRKQIADRTPAPAAKQRNRGKRSARA